jgi:hypothetical protein
MSVAMSIEHAVIDDSLAQEGTSLGSAQPFRAANEFLRKVIDRDADDLIAFFCECDEGDCYAPVWLTTVEYRSLVAHGARIHVNGHAGRT